MSSWVTGVLLTSFAAATLALVVGTAVMYAGLSWQVKMDAPTAAPPLARPLIFAIFAGIFMMAAMIVPRPGWNDQRRPNDLRENPREPGDLLPKAELFLSVKLDLLNPHPTTVDLPALDNRSSFGFHVLGPVALSKLTFAFTAHGAMSFDLRDRRVGEFFIIEFEQVQELPRQLTIHYAPDKATAAYHPVTSWATVGITPLSDPFLWALQLR